jgi:dipeptidyl aminopeptidase/acylaminoacyl peptidase
VGKLHPGTTVTLIFHGEADKLVPIQQSKLLVEKLKEKGVEAQLIAKPGIGVGGIADNSRRGC